MIPWRQGKLTPAMIDVFRGLRGKALDRAVATGNYDSLPKREPGEDLEEINEPVEEIQA